MRIHYLQHVPFEDLANIEAWAGSRGHTLSRTLLFREEPLPGTEGFDWLMILGGPMNIHEHEKHPWLVREKEFIRRAIARGKIVLGICLGAQLLADVVGGKVSRNEHREIGWHPVRLTLAAQASPIFGVLPEEFVAFTGTAIPSRSLLAQQPWPRAPAARIRPSCSGGPWACSFTWNPPRTASITSSATAPTS